MKPAILAITTTVLLSACGSNSDNSQTPDPSASSQPAANTAQTGNNGAEDSNVPNSANSADNDAGTTGETTDSSGAPVLADPTDSTEPTNNTPDPGDAPTNATEPPDATGSTDTAQQPAVTDPPEDVVAEPTSDSNADTPATINLTDCEVPAAQTTIVSASTPLISTGNPYYPDAGPQCVYPASQYDGPGLRYGDFLLLNNAWNGQQSSWDWQQCITVSAAGDGSYLPSWTYDWGNEDDLQPGLFEWEVKSFPEVVYGAISNTEASASCTQTGLPVLAGSIPDMSIAYSYRTQQTDNRVGDRGDEAMNPPAVTGGDRNIAIESFFHSSCDLKRGADSNMELELMVWLEVGNERLPSGSAPQYQFTSSTGGIYDVYTKPGTDKYIAYVARNTVQSDTLEWNDFIDDAKANAAVYGIRNIQDSWCFANIIFGSEIWWGEGSVNLDFYEITSRY